MYTFMYVLHIFWTNWVFISWIDILYWSNWYWLGKYWTSHLYECAQGEGGLRRHRTALEDGKHIEDAYIQYMHTYIHSCIVASFEIFVGRVMWWICRLAVWAIGSHLFYNTYIHWGARGGGWYGCDRWLCEAYSFIPSRSLSSDAEIEMRQSIAGSTVDWGQGWMLLVPNFVQFYS